MSKANGTRLWIKLIVPGVGQIGPGKIALLEAIDRERSISSAARSMGMSYRRAWSLVDDLNQMFDVPVVETSIGGSSRGGATLTHFGMKLVRDFTRAQAKSEKACDQILGELAEHTKPRT